MTTVNNHLKENLTGLEEKLLTCYGGHTPPQSSQKAGPAQEKSFR